MRRYNKQLSYNISKRTDTIKYIVVHDTGNPSIGADAKAHFDYFNGGNRSSSADIFVDDREVWAVNDYNKYYAWHCGDGKGRYGITNANSIGVEICVNQDGDYNRAIANTVNIVRTLMDELNVPLKNVVRHYDASRKNCPSSMSKNNWESWDKFKERLNGGLTMSEYQELKKELTEITETLKILASEMAGLKYPMIYNYIDDNMPEWSKPTIQKLVNKGYLQGDDKGLNLTDDLLRILVINDRAGLYD